MRTHILDLEHFSDRTTLSSEKPEHPELGEVVAHSDSELGYFDGREWLHIHDAATFAALQLALRARGVEPRQVHEMVEALVDRALRTIMGDSIRAMIEEQIEARTPENLKRLVQVINRVSGSFMEELAAVGIQLRDQRDGADEATAQASTGTPQPGGSAASSATGPTG